MIDPGPGGRGASGMEYPTLFTAGTRTHSVRRKVYPWLATSRSDEVTILHEFGHQYFYGLLGSNEFEEAWLDEGMNSYAESRAMTESMLELFGGAVQVSGGDYHRIPAIALPHEGAMLRNSWEYAAARPTGKGSASMVGYGIAAYPKSTTVLRTFENLVGTETMDTIFKAYLQQWRFRHPTSEDFFNVVAEVTGEDYHWYWDQFVRRDRMVDYRARWVKSRKIKDEPGFYDHDGERVEVKAEDLEGEDDDDEAWDGDFETVVVFDRAKEGVVPVDWEVHFSDGHIESGTWDGVARDLSLRFVHSTFATVAVIDPQQKLLIDLSLANNSLLARPVGEDKKSDELVAATESVGKLKAVLKAVAAGAAHLLSLLF